MSFFKKIASGAAIAALSVLAIVPAPANAELTVPKNAWPVCDDFMVDFCIESVSIQPLGARSGLVLEWFDSGSGPEIFVDEETITGVDLVSGPDVVVPGESGSFVLTVPSDAASFNILAVAAGVGRIDGSAMTDAGATSVTVNVRTTAQDQGAGSIAFFADANNNDRGDAAERIAIKGYAVGSSSTAGTGTNTVIAGTNLKGRWSHPKWANYGLDTYGYDGLFIDFKAANAFTNHLFFTVVPVKADPTNKTTKATRDDGSALSANLNLDDKITVKLRMNAIQTGVSIGIANNLNLNAITGTQENPGELTLSGTPVPVPQITNSNQCIGETSKATAVVNTMQGFIIVENDDMGFGVDGLSGRMTVSSNGASCGISTPTWDQNTESLSWQAGAPHFEPDGVTKNKGFYKAVIPANDALLLWGLEDPRRAVTALTISVLNEAGGPAVAASKVAYLHGNIIIDVTGFNFSKPKIQIKKTSGFTGFAKIKTLTCNDPLTKKIVKVKGYGCPKAAEKPVQTFMSAAFANNVSSIPASGKSKIQSDMRGFIEANKFICTGIYKPNASAAEMSLAKKRATATCNYAKSLDRTLSYFAQAKPSRAASYQNKVMVTMKDQKS
jgi:hypothetical protein